MNILFYRYGSICEPDIIEGFIQLGHNVTEITAEITDKRISPKQTLQLLSEKLESYPADFIFSINFYPIISDICSIYKIPYLCWIVDAPVLELYTTAVTNPYNRIFVFDSAMYQEFVSFNPSCIFYLPLAVNVKAKQKTIAEMPSATRAAYTADVSFVGSLYSEKCPYDDLTIPSDYYRGYFHALMQAQLKVYGYYFIEEVLTDDMITELKKCNPNFFTFSAESYLNDRTTFALYYMGNKITALERAETMKQLSEHFSTSIYTGSDTSMYPQCH